jgi:signal transduction histidine kinase
MQKTAERTPLLRVTPMSAEQARRVLAPPWMPPMLARAIGRACRARPLAVPVRLIAPHAALATRLARALHAVTGGQGDLLVATDGRPELRALPLGATIVLDPGALDEEACCTLEALLDDGEVWVIAAGGGTEMPASLSDRLAAITVDVPPLARRQLELTALSTAILGVLAARAGRPAPALSAAARRRLATHPWPGDLVELEAVLGRALATTDTDTVDVAHLDLEGDADADAVAVDVPAPETTPAPALPDPRLEILVAELAHEILNPLATVKMFVGHLPQLLADAESRDAMAGRADEAIARVDGLLQNVLEYARLGAPAPQPVQVGPLLDRLLREAAPELAERAVRVRRTGGDAVTCVGDPAQLEYGFRNLLAGVVREVPPREEFAVDATQNGVVAVRFAGGDVTASRLRAMVPAEGTPRLEDPTMLPLSLTIAKAVVERNGGTLGVHEEADGPTTLVVRLPTTMAG